MSFTVIVGAGATGAATARSLAASGDRIRLISRRGSGPDHPQIERVAADATDANQLTRLTDGARTLITCAMPPYDRWPDEFPPLAAALLATAERTGAGYVMLGNTYGYGPVDGPIAERLPMMPTTVKGRVRAQIWNDALASHQAGRARVTEVRANDFIGRGAVSPFTIMVGRNVLAGEPVSFPGDLDAPHSWTYVGDVARTLVAASQRDLAWGRAWHVPSTATISVRELATRLASVAGVPAPRLSRMSAEEVDRIGATDSIMREISEMLYLFERPSILDSSETERVLGVSATPLDEALADLIRAS
jgi:nucleoside-diphosphate-sugar epimerase